MKTFEDAKVLYDSGNYSGAFDILRGLIAECPADRDVRLFLSKVLIKMERYHEAMIDLCILVSKDPQDTEALTMIAHIKEKEGNVSSEETLFKKALKRKAMAKSPLEWDLKDIDKKDVLALLNYLFDLTDHLPYENHRDFIKSPTRTSLLRLINILNLP